MITGIAHNAVTVRDMQESLRFYTEALGFIKAFEIDRPENGAPWIVYLSVAPGQFLELFYGGTEDNPWRDTLIGFNHFCFEVDDIFQSHLRKLKSTSSKFLLMLIFQPLFMNHKCFGWNL